MRTRIQIEDRRDLPGRGIDELAPAGEGPPAAFSPSGEGLPRPTLTTNVVANYVGRLVAGILGFVCPPYFASVIGAEGYGLVGFYVSLWGILSVMDLGLSATLQRELAMLSADPSGRSIDRAKVLVRTFAIVFWAMGLASGVVLVAFAPTIAEHWVRAQSSSPGLVVGGIRAIGIVVALQWPASMYVGVLIGLQQQVRANYALIVGTAFRLLGTTLVLAWVSATVEAFFVCQVVSAVIQLGLTRHLVRRTLAGGWPASEFTLIRRLWRFSSRIWIVALLDAGINQIDKVIASKRLSLAEFGHYSLAAAVTTGIVHLSIPVWSAFYPKLCELAEAGDAERVEDYYHRGAQLMTVMVIPACVVFCVFGPDVLLAWTGSAELADRLRWPATFFVLGATCNALTYLPLGVQFAYGVAGPAAMVNVVTLAVMVAALSSSSTVSGGASIAGAWAALNALHAVALVAVTHTRILRRQTIAWVAVDVGVPTLGAIIGALATRHFLPVATTRAGGLLSGGAAYVPTLVAAVALSPAVRARVAVRWKAFAHRSRRS